MIVRHYLTKPAQTTILRILAVAILILLLLIQAGVL